MSSPAVSPNIPCGGADRARTVTVAGQEGPTDRVHPDTVLLRACAAFDDLERLQQLVGTVRLSRSAEAVEEAEADRRRQRQFGLLETILARQATTLEGVRAKAAMLYLWDGELGQTDETFWNGMLVRSIVGDLLSMPDRKGDAVR